MQRFRGLLFLVVAASSCSRGERQPSPATDSSEAKTTQLARADSLTDEEPCQKADSLWHCLVAPGFVIAIHPHFATDSNGVATLHRLTVTSAGSATIPAQELTTDLTWGMFSPPTQDDVGVFDYDRNGFRDIRVRHPYGMAANEGYDIWRYDPASHQFAFDSTLSQEANVDPDSIGCVQSSGISGNTSEVHSSRFCLRNGKWVRVG